MKHKPKILSCGLSLVMAAAASAAILSAVSPAQAADKKPNIVMLMTDDTGWNDFGCYSGGGAGRASDTECRSHRQGGCRLHLLVRAGELHGWSSLVHDRAYPNPFSALDRGCPG